MKLEGAGMCYGHKFRSAAYVVAKAVEQGIPLSRVADRSSGSWAMGLAWAVNVAGGRSRFVTQGEPSPYVRAFVEALEGEFEVVHSNLERKSALERLKSQGYYVPDQHANGLVIEAFEQTLGKQLLHQLREHEVVPDVIVAPVGTGGLLSGTVRALRTNYPSLTSVGVDLSSSVVHDGPRSITYPHVKVRGVGSEDEYCKTLKLARSSIDQIGIASIFAALDQQLEFTRQFPASIGLSSGLALAWTEQYLRRLPKKDEIPQIVVILPDRGETYAHELSCANTLFSRPIDSTLCRHG
jgi:cysteine synthase